MKAGQALVGAGSNLGDRCATLQAALRALRDSAGIGWAEASSVYETAPVGVTDQPPFLNAVFGLETTLSPEDLLTTLLGIEQRLGRVRTIRWGPRTLDLDLLAYDNATRTTEFLQLPHPRMWERDFVKVPLAELLGRPRFQHGIWDEFRARLRTAAPADGVSLAATCRLQP